MNAPFTLTLGALPAGHVIVVDVEQDDVVTTPVEVVVEVVVKVLFG